MNLLYNYAKYSGIVARAPAIDKKCDVFCLPVCLSRFGITKFVITEML